jgi:hypothetical protein
MGKTGPRNGLSADEPKLMGRSAVIAEKFRKLRKLIGEYQSTAESMLNRNGERASDQCFRCLYLREMRALFSSRAGELPTTLELRNAEGQALTYERVDREADAMARKLPTDPVDLIDAEIMRGMAALCFGLRRSFSPEQAAAALAKHHRQMLVKCETLWRGDRTWYSPFRDQRQQKVQALADAIVEGEKPDAQAGKRPLRDRSAPASHRPRSNQHPRPQRRP